ncbi:MAG: hypothetical protein COU40_02840 [Candidatus Moranbacteria bacterium CG10_big_fil_rev_8_21_14_0_10_35_21]|nr:MAG: hypothetical protein COU40_02840 [Candidatus Moranbacteria bacterium CG10_big_fil_rev_8_21_14_0_10_35_21]
MKRLKYLDIKREKKPLIEEEISDSDAIKLVKEGKTDIFEKIIERYQGKLFFYIFRLTGDREEARDLLQDVFIKAYRNIASFDIERKFSSWIYRIAHNEAINYLKRKSLKRFISWEDVSSAKDTMEMNSGEESVSKLWERKDEIKEVNVAVNKLPIKYKQVLLLKYFSDKSYEEIGEILGKPVNTVGTLISRAKKKLHKEINNLNNKK